MSPRPNPTQTIGTDEQEERRVLQGWLRPPYALDAREQRRQLDEGATDNVARNARRAALDDWAGTHGGAFVLTAGQLEELRSFLHEGGARPSFVWPARPGGYLTPEEQLQLGKAAELRAAAEPKEDPDEPGRFVRARGRFATAGAEGFTPDPR